MIELLDDFRPGSSFLFIGPERGLLAHGTDITLPGRDGDLPARVAAVLGALGGDRIVVGAIPFDDDAPTQLIVPVTVRWATAAQPAAAPVSGNGTVPAYAIRPVPEPADYLHGVRRALDRVAGGELDKVVLARSLHLTASTAIDVRRLLANLASRDPNGYTFAVDLPGGRTLLGASPELLLSRRGDRVLARPLAGSAARAGSPDSDARRGRDLLESTKDRHEHAVVVDAIAATLGRYCRQLSVPAAPSLVRTAAMWHLASTITGRLTDPGTSALALASALHPTPAVCGTPVGPARAAIRDLESFDRGFYTGMVGWMDASGDGEWVVTIRCGEADQHSLRLYAGAGIVAGSRPDDELAETSAKFRTLLSAMGVAQAV